MIWSAGQPDAGFHVRIGVGAAAKNGGIVIEVRCTLSRRLRNSSGATSALIPTRLRSSWISVAIWRRSELEELTAMVNATRAPCSSSSAPSGDQRKPAAQQYCPRRWSERPGDLVSRPATPCFPAVPATERHAVAQVDQANHVITADGFRDGLPESLFAEPSLPLQDRRRAFAGRSFILKNRKLYSNPGPAFLQRWPRRSPLESAAKFLALTRLMTSASPERNRNTCISSVPARTKCNSARYGRRSRRHPSSSSKDYVPVRCAARPHTP